MNIYFEDLAEENLLKINGGASISTSFAVYSTGISLFGFATVATEGAALLIGAGAATHTAGVWLFGDSIKNAIRK